MVKDQARSRHTAHKRPEIHPIHVETIETFLGDEHRPHFIAVLRKDHDLVNLIRQLEDIASAFEKQDLLICYTLDDLLPYFMNRFQIGGTPTYLLISNGLIKGTMLGRNETRAIIEFIRQNLPKNLPDKGPVKSGNTSGTGQRTVRQR